MYEIEVSRVPIIVPSDQLGNHNSMTSSIMDTLPKVASDKGVIPPMVLKDINKLIGYARDKSIIDDENNGLFITS